MREHDLLAPSRGARSPRRDGTIATERVDTMRAPMKSREAESTKYFELCV
jgi:hypothetical protein